MDVNGLLHCGKEQGVAVGAGGSPRKTERGTMPKSWMCLPLLALAPSAAAQTHEDHSGHAASAKPERAMLLQGYGVGGFAITAGSREAQAYFDNGMQLAAAFEHNAAVVAMQEAQRLDPQCAMCVWGEAWAGGPTINFGKSGHELERLRYLADKARKMARVRGTDSERALTEAMVARYDEGGGGRYRQGGKSGDLAFAQAMEAIARANPGSDPFMVMAADAWMQAPAPNAGDYEANSAKALPFLETVLERSPDYTPAIHFYIHASEEAGHSARAETAADRLGALAPNAQHLVHMPSHTYYWVGRYADAARVNRQAVEIGIAQAKAMSAPPPPGIFGLPYHAHNITMGLGGALMAGDRDTALWLGRPLVEKAAVEAHATPFQQALAGSGYVALAMFADAKEILAAPKPKLPILLGMWHYARGEAFAKSGNARAVRAEAARLATPEVDEQERRSWQAAQTLKIARHVLEGRALILEGRPAAAALAFERGAALQEVEEYRVAADPPLWWFPVRRALAETRFAAGDPAGARADAEATLKQRPKDPGALALLAKLDGAIAAR